MNIGVNIFELDIFALQEFWGYWIRAFVSSVAVACLRPFAARSVYVYQEIRRIGVHGITGVWPALLVRRWHFLGLEKTTATCRSENTSLGLIFWPQHRILHCQIFQQSLSTIVYR